jgi:copper chaperone CopZ
VDARRRLGQAGVTTACDTQKGVSTGGLTRGDALITVDYSLVAFRVSGLNAETCGHCLADLRAELTHMAGVLAVDIAAAQGKVCVIVDDLTAAECAADALADAGWDSDRMSDLQHCS